MSSKEDSNISLLIEHPFNSQIVYLVPLFFYIGHGSCTDLLPGNYCQIIAHDAPEDCLNPGIEKECCASCKSVDTKALSEDRLLRLSTSSCLVHNLFEIVYLKLWAKMFLY